MAIIAGIWYAFGRKGKAENRPKGSQRVTDLSEDSRLKSSVDSVSHKTSVSIPKRKGISNDTPMKGSITENNDYFDNRFIDSNAGSEGSVGSSGKEGLSEKKVTDKSKSSPKPVDKKVSKSMSPKKIKKMLENK